MKNRVIFNFEDQLDNGAKIRVSININQDSIKVDFSGTDPVLDGNQNANPAIVFFRCDLCDAVLY